MKYLENTILTNFDTIQIDDTSNILGTSNTGKLNIYTYDIQRIQRIYQYIDICPTSWFGYTNINNNTNLEKLSYDIYSDPDYWDVILIVNKRLPLFDNSYDYDVLNNIADSAIERYEEQVYKRKLPEKIKEQFRLMYLDKVTETNEKNRIVKYVYPECMYDFLQNGISIGAFK